LTTTLIERFAFDLRSLRDAQSSTALLRCKMYADARKLKEDAPEASTGGSKRVLHSGFLRRRETEEGGDSLSVSTQAEEGPYEKVEAHRGISGFHLGHPGLA
jgi:hypothetical protein